MFIYDMFNESVDIFLMESGAEFNHEIRMSEITFMEDENTEIFTESVVDSVKEFLSKIAKKVMELVEAVRDKITEKMAEAKIRKAVEGWRKLNQYDIQATKNRKMSWIDWRAFDKRITECCKDYKKLVDRVDKMKIDTPEDARKVMKFTREAADEFNKKWTTGTAEDFMRLEAIHTVLGCDVVNLSKKYNEAFKTRMRGFNSSDENVDSSLSKESNTNIIKAKAEALRKIVSVKLCVAKHWAQTYGALMIGTVLNISGTINSLYSSAATAIGIASKDKKVIANGVKKTVVNAAVAAAGDKISKYGMKNLHD